MAKEEGPDETPLTDPKDAIWTRVGGSAATGLSAYGLKWTANSATSAKITKDTAEKLVLLSSGDWDIETLEDLSAAVDAASDIAEYTGVSATAASKNDYTDILGVKKGSDYYIIKIVSSTVATGASTTITINVKYKEEE
ncbi:MAG: hypothetical protein HC896_18915 [Bacteroidales bacterium]|nr:hypothetical protein [Bacteroidales bacterium]